MIASERSRGRRLGKPRTRARNSGPLYSCRLQGALQKDPENVVYVVARTRGDEGNICPDELVPQR